jgi:hypothetical protein
MISQTHSGLTANHFPFVLLVLFIIVSPADAFNEWRHVASGHSHIVWPLVTTAAAAVAFFQNALQKEDNVLERPHPKEDMTIKEYVASFFKSPFLVKEARLTGELGHEYLDKLLSSPHKNLVSSGSIVQFHRAGVVRRVATSYKLILDLQEQGLLTAKELEKVTEDRDLQALVTSQANGFVSTLLGEIPDHYIDKSKSSTEQLSNAVTWLKDIQENCDKLQRKVDHYQGEDAAGHGLGDDERQQLRERIQVLEEENNQLYVDLKQGKLRDDIS